MNSTIQFTADRINRKPSVYRSMTMLELMLVLLGSAMIGGFIGIIVMIIFRVGFYVIAIMSAVAMGLGVKFGGAYIARLKRGRPENYFDCFLDLKFHPKKYITLSQKWSIRRSIKTK